MDLFVAEVDAFDVVSLKNFAIVKIPTHEDVWLFQSNQLVANFFPTYEVLLEVQGSHQVNLAPIQTRNDRKLKRRSKDSNPVVDEAILQLAQESSLAIRDFSVQLFPIEVFLHSHTRKVEYVGHVFKVNRRVGSHVEIFDLFVEVVVNCFATGKVQAAEVAIVNVE